MVWPAVQLVNFKLVPLNHRLLVVNIISLGMCLSWRMQSPSSLSYLCSWWLQAGTPTWVSSTHKETRAPFLARLSRQLRISFFFFFFPSFTASSKQRRVLSQFGILVFFFFFLDFHPLFIELETNIPFNSWGEGGVGARVEGNFNLICLYKHIYIHTAIFASQNHALGDPNPTYQEKGIVRKGI